MNPNHSKNVSKKASPTVAWVVTGYVDPVSPLVFDTKYVLVVRCGALDMKTVSNGRANLYRSMHLTYCA